MVAHVWRECYIAMGIAIPNMGAGAIIAFPSCLVPGITSIDSDFRTTKENALWIAAAAGISAAANFMIACPMMQLYGRKTVMIVIHVCNIIGCIMMALAYDVTTLFIARLLHGMSIPGLVLSTVLIAEYSHPKRRGVFVSIKLVFLNTGIMLLHMLSYHFTWRQLAWLMIIPPSLAILLVFTWPESPSWLAYRDRFPECIEAFEWIRGTDEESKAEVTRLIADQRKLQAVVRKGNNFRRIFRALTTTELLKPVAVAVSLVTLTEFSGLTYLVACIIDIMTEISGGDQSAVYYYTMGIDIMRIITMVVFMAIERLLKRRRVLLAGGGISAVVLLASCLMQYLQELNLVAAWLAPWGLILYNTISNLTVLPVILVMKGEVIPLEYRGLGMAILGVCDSLLYSFLTRVTPNLLVSLKSYGTFGLYLIVVIAMLVILYFILPETKDRTLQDVESKFIDFDKLDKSDRQAVLLIGPNQTSTNITKRNVIEK